MPLTETDARALLAAVLAAHGEDYDQIGRLLALLVQLQGAGTDRSITWSIRKIA